MENPEYPIHAATGYRLPGTLDISGALDIYSCQAVANELRAYLLTAPAILLDLSGVTGCDLAGLQLLCSARRSAFEARKPFHLTPGSPVVNTLIAGYGLPADYFLT